MKLFYEKDGRRIGNSIKIFILLIVPYLTMMMQYILMYLDNHKDDYVIIDDMIISRIIMIITGCIVYGYIHVLKSMDHKIRWKLDMINFMILFLLIVIPLCLPIFPAFINIFVSLSYTSTIITIFLGISLSDAICCVYQLTHK